MVFGKCIVDGCKTSGSNRDVLGVALHTIPVNKVTEWLTAVRKEDLLLSNSVHSIAKNKRICSKHFSRSSYIAQNASSSKSRLKPYAIPSVPESLELGVENAACGTTNIHEDQRKKEDRIAFEMTQMKLIASASQLISHPETPTSWLQPLKEVCLVIQSRDAGLTEAATNGFKRKKEANNVISDSENDRTEVKKEEKTVQLFNTPDNDSSDFATPKQKKMQTKKEEELTFDSGIATAPFGILSEQECQIPNLSDFTSVFVKQEVDQDLESDVSIEVPVFSSNDTTNKEEKTT